MKSSFFCLLVAMFALTIDPVRAQHCADLSESHNLARLTQSAELIFTAAPVKVLASRAFGKTLFIIVEAEILSILKGRIHDENKKSRMMIGALCNDCGKIRSGDIPMYIWGAIKSPQIYFGRRWRDEYFPTDRRNRILSSWSRLENVTVLSHLCSMTEATPSIEHAVEGLLQRDSLGSGKYLIEGPH
jgi:hypothetical protein